MPLYRPLELGIHSDPEPTYPDTTKPSSHLTGFHDPWKTLVIILVPETFDDYWSLGLDSACTVGVMFLSINYSAFCRTYLSLSVRIRWLFYTSHFIPTISYFPSKEWWPRNLICRIPVSYTLYARRCAVQLERASELPQYSARTYLSWIVRSL